MLRVVARTRSSLLSKQCSQIAKAQAACFSTENKRGGKKKSEGGDSVKVETENLLKFYNAVEDAKWMKATFSEEELAEHNRIGREYHRQFMIRKNKMDHDITNKIWLQQEAIRALPAELREHALVADWSSPPEDRPWPEFDTPPIKDFNLEALLEGETGMRSSSDEEEKASA